MTDKDFSAAFDKFAKTLKDVNDSKETFREIALQEISALKKDVEDMSHNFNDLKKIVEKISKDVEEVNEIRSQGKALVIVGKALIAIGAGVAAFFLFVYNHITFK